MFDISSKTNKFGDLAYIETVNEKEQNMAYHLQKNFSIDLPAIKSSIKFAYNYDKVPNSAILDDEYYEQLKAEIKIGKKQKLNVKLDTPNADKDKVKSVRRFDFNNLVRTICAYAYFVDNFDQLVLQGKSKKELKKLSISELEQITMLGEKAHEEFKAYIIALCSGMERKDIQELVDSLFGQNKINVDNLVEKNIDQALVEREKETEENMELS